VGFHIMMLMLILVISLIGGGVMWYVLRDPECKVCGQKILMGKYCSAVCFWKEKDDF